MFIYFIIMSIALSVDALGIGISYRLNGVRIPLRSKLIIGIVTTAIMIGALMVGSLFHNGLPGQISKFLGAGVLILTGIIFIRNSLAQEEKETYDFDHSREIEVLEAILLAVALSADSIGAGIAVASTGMDSCMFGLMVGAMQLIFLFLADFLVEKVTSIQKFNQKVCGLISGCLLLIIGILRCLP